MMFNFWLITFVLISVAARASIAKNHSIFDGLDQKTYLGEFKYTKHLVQGQVCLSSNIFDLNKLYLPTNFSKFELLIADLSRQ